MIHGCIAVWRVCEPGRHSQHYYRDPYLQAVARRAEFLGGLEVRECCLEAVAFWVAGLSEIFEVWLDADELSGCVCVCVSLCVLSNISISTEEWLLPEGFSRSSQLRLNSEAEVSANNRPGNVRMYG